MGNGKPISVRAESKWTWAEEKSPWGSVREKDQQSMVDKYNKIYIQNQCQIYVPIHIHTCTVNCVNTWGIINPIATNTEV